MLKYHETYISVDVESAGPNPSTYSLLSIGACSVFNPERTFYVELQPVNEYKLSKALDISGLDWEKLKTDGFPPKGAMARFANWLKDFTNPIFVAFNAPFDWMFVNDYFQRYLGHNPFGHKALDMKALYMGMHGVSWEETGMNTVSKHYLDNQILSHHALQDALDQAKIFHKMLAEMNE